ncbi:MAG: prolipoprotein diacylglyceryl transferase [Eggerthellaceae bacterium]|jgi:phosphatidylglycerol:prolipoprotein diacylglycerol transferase
MLNDLYQSLDPVAFSIGPLTVRWYALAYIAGFACALFVMWRVSKRWKVRIDSDALLTILLCVMVGVILGARLGYVLFYGAGYYLVHPEEILAFNKGGMSFHGGLVGALLAGIVAAKLTHIPYLTLADLAVIGAPIGLFFGRCANFVNGELWGAVTDVPWGVVFGGAAGTLPRHPSQLYEALLEGVMLFIILYALSRKRPPRPRGTFLGIFLIIYGICRFLIEFVRQPDVQLGYLWGGWLTMGQVLSVPLIIAGICILIFAVRKKLPQQGLDGLSGSQESPEG